MFFAFFFVKPTCNEVDLAHQNLVYKTKKSTNMHKTLCDSNAYVSILLQKILFCNTKFLKISNLKNADP